MTAVAHALAPSPDVICSHCGLVVPLGLLDPAAQQQFCCAGCRTVFTVLHGEGLEAYYAFRERSGARGEPARTTGRAYDELADPSFTELYVRPTAGGLLSSELYLEGVHCAACLWLVERLPRVCAGVAEARLSLGKNVVRLSWDPLRVTLPTAARALDRLGYPPHPVRGVSERQVRRREDRRFLVRIAVAGAVMGNVMLLTLALYSGMFDGMEAHYERMFRWFSLVLTAPSVFWAGNIFLRGAWSALRTRTPHLDLPISIGILAGYLWGGWNTLRASGEIYFDSVATLIFALLVGRFLQRRQQRAASDATELMQALAPSVARKLHDEDGVREVPMAALLAGMRVEVRAGDSVPVDGVVEEGTSSVDAAVLTGESVPVDVWPGSLVHAGSVSLSGRLVVRAIQTGEATRLGRLLKSVEEAAQRRAPVVQLANRVAGWFVFVALGLAFATAALWWSTDAALAMDHAVALLIVTCPCALGLATPLAVSAALGRAARRGILIKGGDALELLARPSDVVFDKTGTLTEGRMELVAWHGDEAAKGALAALEACSSHPIARATVRALGAELRATDVLATHGGGLSGRVDGCQVVAGTPSFVANALGQAGVGEREAAEVTARGLTPVCIATDGRLVAVAGFGDPIRCDAATSLGELRRLGYVPRILSGDHEDVVRSVAKKLDVATFRGGVSPEEKLADIELARQHGRVIMVGDGVNDAAALSAATVGVAVHGGAEASLAAADVFLSRAGVAPVVELVRGARRTLAVIRRGIVFALVYNTLGVTLAMTGLLSPIVASIVMPIGSLTVVMMAYRSRTFGSEP